MCVAKFSDTPDAETWYREVCEHNGAPRLTTIWSGEPPISSPRLQRDVRHREQGRQGERLLDSENGGMSLLRSYLSPPPLAAGRLSSILVADVGAILAGSGVNRSTKAAGSKVLQYHFPVLPDNVEKQKCEVSLCE